MEFKQRETWKNITKNQITVPLRTYTPTNLDELVEIVKEAESLNLQVRAVGSGLSFSDVALANDFLIKPEGLSKVWPPSILDTLLFKDDLDTSHLVQMESGVQIKRLNDILFGNKLALPNMGGYDKQTFVGAMSTSTHGSGLDFGPFCDFLESLEILSHGGILYRVEPINGPTDRTKYEAQFPPDTSGRKLIQDDKWFNAVKMSMGCMGIIYSLIIKVTDRFWLKEVRKTKFWQEVKQDLIQGDVFKDNRHYELIINPYISKGHSDHLCLITTRNPLEPPSNGKPKKHTHRNFFSELLASIPLASQILKKILGDNPEITPEIIDQVIKGLKDKDYTNVSYRVFNIGVANKIPAYSCEIGFPMKDNKYIDAVDHFLQLARRDQELGELYLTSPTALRFVKASPAYLSPQFGENTCMMEIIVQKGTKGGFQIFQRLENELYKFSGRPHWGQVNSLTGSNNFIAGMYPKYREWHDIYLQLNPKGTFDNPFSKRVGFCEKAWNT
jgi:D-arabinono-1,4-lactone oxidase/FAD binding domain